MNNLSWLLYLGDVLPNFVILVVIITVIVIFIGGFLLFPIFDLAEEDFANSYFKAWKKIVVFCLIASSIAVFIPSTKTIYMIAASEMAGTLITSPEGKEMIGLIREGLIEELKDNKSTSK